MLNAARTVYRPSLPDNGVIRVNFIPASIFQGFSTFHPQLTLGKETISTVGQDRCNS